MQDAKAHANQPLVAGHIAPHFSPAAQVNGAALINHSADFRLGGELRLPRIFIIHNVARVHQSPPLSVGQIRNDAADTALVNGISPAVARYGPILFIAQGKKEIALWHIHPIDRRIELQLPRAQAVVRGRRRYHLQGTAKRPHLAVKAVGADRKIYIPQPIFALRQAPKQLFRLYHSR